MNRSGKSQDTALTRSGAKRNQEGEAIELVKLLKQFAYQPIYFSESDEEARKVKTQLAALLKARWGTFDRDVAQKGRALLEWILLCPPLLKGQPGFEWIHEEFVRLLMQRLSFWDLGQKAVLDAKGQLVGVDDQLFWKIVSSVRGKLNKGHPASVAKDYARANRVMFLRLFKNPETGHQFLEDEACKLIAQLEVCQRVLDAPRFLYEAGEILEEEANRMVTSWGIDQRAGAIAFLISSGKIEEGGTEESKAAQASRLIDQWNFKQKIRRATEFLHKKLQYTKPEAETLVDQWNFHDLTGKDAAIRHLIEKHGYKEGNAAKIVNRWGNTEPSFPVDPSPVYASLRVVKEQGRWAGLEEEGLGDKEEGQTMINLLLQIFKRHESARKGETGDFTKEEERELQRLSTRLWRHQPKK